MVSIFSPGRWRTGIIFLLIVTMIISSAPVALANNTTHPSSEVRELPHPSSLPDDVQLGLEVTVAISETIGFNDDYELSERINRIGYRVAAAAGEWDHPFSFHLLDIPEPNAMALPGGFLFVTTGMLDLDLTDDELAHLIGHEMTHVRRNHHARASKVNTLISLVQTALMMGILIGVPDNSAASQRVSVNDDPGVNEWGVGVSGKQALLQGSSLLGGVMQALFDRGFSRKLEYEADDGGTQMATKAGYDPGAGISMLQKLRDRSYEGHRFSYWRTHPYFNDRVARARSRLSYLASDKLTSETEQVLYRQQTALYFAAAADQMYDKQQAKLLYHCALQAEPAHIASPQIALEIIRLKVRREETLHPLFRLYTPLIADFDSLIVSSNAITPPWSNITRARTEREELESRRDGLLTDYQEILDSEEYSTHFLWLFINNYPEHDRTSEMTCLLGVNYILSDEPTSTIDLLEEYLTRENEGIWADSARVILVDAINEVDDPLTCYQFITPPQESAPGSDQAGRTEAIITAARERMDYISEHELTMKIGSTFLLSYPESEWSTLIREKVWDDARKSFENGRMQEGLYNLQEALNIYFTILALAPAAPVARLAEASIERLHRLEALGDYK